MPVPDGYPTGLPKKNLPKVHTKKNPYYGYPTSSTTKISPSKPKDPPPKPIQTRYIASALSGLEVLQPPKLLSTSDPKALLGLPEATDAAIESKRDDNVHPLILEGRALERLKRPERVLNGEPPTALSQIWTYFVIRDGTGNIQSLAHAKPFGVSIKTDFEEAIPVVTLRPIPQHSNNNINPLSIMTIMANDLKADSITTIQIHNAMTLAGDILNPSELLSTSDMWR